MLMGPRTFADSDPRAVHHARQALRRTVAAIPRHIDGGPGSLRRLVKTTTAILRIAQLGQQVRLVFASRIHRSGELKTGPKIDHSFGIGARAGFCTGGREERVNVQVRNV